MDSIRNWIPDFRFISKCRANFMATTVNRWTELLIWTLSKCSPKTKLSSKVQRFNSTHTPYVHRSFIHTSAMSIRCARTYTTHTYTSQICTLYTRTHIHHTTYCHAVFLRCCFSGRRSSEAIGRQYIRIRFKIQPNSVNFHDLHNLFSFTHLAVRMPSFAANQWTEHSHSHRTICVYLIIVNTQREICRKNHQQKVLVQRKNSRVFWPNYTCWHTILDKPLGKASISLMNSYVDVSTRWECKYVYVVLSRQTWLFIFDFSVVGTIEAVWMRCIRFYNTRWLQI